MAYANVKADFLASADRRKPSRMPVVSLALEFHMVQGGLSNRDTRLNVDKMVDNVCRAVEEYGEDWAIIFPDDYIEFEPLGLKMSDFEDHPTMPTEYPPLKKETLSKFRIPDPKKDMRLPIHLEMIRKTKERLGDDTLVMGRVAGPYSALGLVYGIDNLMIATLTEPDLVRDNMKFFVDYEIMFGQAQIEAGADVIWLGDCCAASNFLRPEHFADFAFEPAAEVGEKLKNRGGLIIYHNAETSMPHLEKQVQLPVHALNLGDSISIAEIREKLDPKPCLMGNFHPNLARDGKPDEIEAAAEAMVRANLPGGGYIFNTAEGVMANTPPANFAAMIRGARNAATCV